MGPLRVYLKFILSHRGLQPGAFPATPDLEIESSRSDLAGEPRLPGTFQNIPCTFKQRG